ncbi:MAG: M4 family metallopeptidase [Holophagaceae bacterium]|nr:M4 family metallopeptidase [Holophagaceae bacterium]
MNTGPAILRSAVSWVFCTAMVAFISCSGGGGTTNRGGGGPAPTITQQPLAQITTLGRSAIFTVTAEGATSYQWQVGTTNIAGATSRSFTVQSATLDQNGSTFRAVASNSSGSTPSDAASLTVNPEPTFTVQPVQVSVYAPEPATYTATVTGGTAPLVFQWQRNGTPIPSATSSTYTLDPTSSNDNGAVFTLGVTDAVGATTTSTVALLTVTIIVPPPAPLPHTPFTPLELAAIALRPGNPDVEVIENDKGEMLGLSGRLAPNDLKSTTEPEAAVRFIQDLGAQAWGWTDPGNAIGVITPCYETIPVAKADNGNSLTMNPVLLVQTFNGVPIETRQASILVTTHSLESGFVIGGYMGDLGPQPDPNTGPSTQAALTDEQAFLKAASDPRVLSRFPDILGASVPKFVPPWPHKAKLLFSDVSGSLRLCYRVFASPTWDGDGARVNLLADANTGALIDIQDEVPSDFHDSTTTVTGTAWAWNSAPAISQALLQDGSSYALAAHLAVGERGLVKVYNGYGSWIYGDLITRSTPNFADTSYFPMRYGTEALRNAQTALEYWRHNFGWMGWNGRGGDLNLVVNYCSLTGGCSWNAYAWAGNIYMPAGVTGSLVRPAGVALDIVGHELMHNVLEAINPLNYSRQSGALNEALADFSGETIRGWSQPILAIDCSAAQNAGIRDMSNPPTFGHPDHFSNFATLADSDDNAGVHYNSGIVNKAHWLMVQGSVGFPFHGYAVEPLDPDLARSTDMASHLVTSALFARLFPSNATLPQYGAGLYSWCRAQAALFGSYGSSANAKSGTVHDALIATGLLPVSAYPVDLALSVRSQQALIGDDGNPYTRITYRISNRGTARFYDVVNFDFCSSDGAISYVQGGFTPTIQPSSYVDGYVDVPHNITPLVSRFNGVLSMSIPGGADTNFANNSVRVRIEANILPANRGYWETLGHSGISDLGVTLSLAMDGHGPLVSGDVASRFLHRRSDSESFHYIPLSSAGYHQFVYPHRLIRTELLSSGGTLNLIENVASGYLISESPVSMAEVTVRIGGRLFGILHMDHNGRIYDGVGTSLSGEMLLAMVNTDGRFPTTPDSNYLYCMNCETAGGAKQAIVRFDDDVPIQNWFPSDLVPVLNRLKPIPTVPLSLYSLMLPTWPVWFISGPGPDPEPIKNLRKVQNAGP